MQYINHKSAVGAFAAHAVHVALRIKALVGIQAG
jgi:hypothetical protein